MTRRRRWLGWLGGLAAFGPLGTAPTLAQPSFSPRLRPALPEALRQQREAWLAQARAALAQGEAAEAEALFERGTQALHAADSELGQVLAVMQQGEYRRACALAAHCAGVHPDAPAAAALYAWLLHLGGQGDFARRVLAQAQGRTPDAALLEAVSQAIVRGEALPPPPLRHSAAHGGPQALGEAPPEGAGVRATACRLGDAGAPTLAPAAACDGLRALWLRDGLGRTWAAERDAGRTAPPGLCWLRARGAAPGAPQLAPLTPRDAFPGSPAYALQFAPSDDAQPAWPQLQMGFLGAAEAGGMRRLGLSLPAGPLGGPVLDGQGRLVGLALGRPDAPARLVPASALALGAGPASAGPAALPLDALYERTLPQVLQVIGG